MQEDTNDTAGQTVEPTNQIIDTSSEPTINSPSNNSSQNEVDSLAHNSVEPTNPEKTEKPRKEGGIFSFILTIVAAFILVNLINMFVFQSYKVFGSSMFPTLHNGDRLIISKVAKTSSKISKNTFQPTRGNIIVFIDPIQPDLQLIKRVIGLPGERVVVKDKKITVYNSAHPEGFNPDDAEYGKVLPPTSGNTDITIPAGHIFVSGDNREGSNSLDSRNELGTVPEENIIGTLMVRVFPFDQARFF